MNGDEHPGDAGRVPRAGQGQGGLCHGLEDQRLRRALSGGDRLDHDAAIERAVDDPIEKAEGMGVLAVHARGPRSGNECKRAVPVLATRSESLV